MAVLPEIETSVVRADIPLLIGYGYVERTGDFIRLTAQGEQALDKYHEELIMSGQMWRD